ncbi:serine/threonine-protein kinase ATR-like isoform X2 [Zingiber officinale]|uniref:serine/threonine-protein kinase ATR-like isoform X2 n=1 Tax=Zingiber officinale TaxID=94328 RepID=UPI001C4DBBF4|nr:serine/threonine-protein kinase ATR-like isoform X2 [Zingiber officinale]
MANISSLIHDLRERIAASTSVAASSSNCEDPVETKFRAVLPNLLHSYVVPSSTGNEREVTAVLKLLSYTARNYPGVFFHGQAAAVLPVVGRVFPFFAEPAFCSRHGVIFETVASLLSLLRTGEREVYRQFFLDAMDVVQGIVLPLLFLPVSPVEFNSQFCNWLPFTDVLYISSNCEKKSRAPSDRVSLKCFSESFSLILDCPVTFSELPVCCRPLDGPGVLIDLTDKKRWQPFAAWTIRLINKCLMEGTLHVEGLINVSFAYSICSLLCYGDATLHMACFDFARITTTVIDADVIPVENVIRSIACILSLDENKSVTFRNTTYDSCMGACLHLLHSSCPDKIIESTASEIINVFSRSICSTESSELQIAMCSAYVRIAKSCHPQIWEPRLLVRMLCLERPCLPLIQCIQAAITILIPSDALEGEVDASTSVTNLKSTMLPKISSKRSMEINSIVECKRQKIAEANIEYTSNFLADIEQKKKFANELCRSICLFLEFAKPAYLKSSPLNPETTITALSLLCLAFSAHPHSSLSSSIFHQNLSWIPWICKQAKDSSLLASVLPTYLQAVHSILCLQDLESREKLFQDDEFLTDVERSSCIYPKYVDLLELLKLPWTYNSIIEQACQVGKIKCLCIQVFSKIGPKLKDESDLEVLDLAIHDEDEEVCIEAVTSMPVIVLCSGQIFFEKMLRKLESVGCTSPRIRRSILFSVGYLSCLYGFLNSHGGHDIPCKLFLGDNYDRQICTSDLLLSGFCCPSCDKIVHNKAQPYNVISMTILQKVDFDCDDNFVKFQAQFFEFLYDDSVEEFHDVCIKLLPRILRHSTKNILLKTRSKWSECIDYLVLHKSKGIRDTFCMEISCFIEDHIFDILFSDLEGNSNAKETRFLDKLNYALAISEDPDILVTILESIAAIMNASDIHRPLFFHSFILFIDQLDSCNQIVKTTALRLLHKSPHFCHKGGFEFVLSKIPHIRDGLYEYVSSRLVNRPAMIREFAEAVLGIKVEELIAKIVPFVMPKLVISHKDNNQALIILHELASHLSIDVVPLIVNWLPKVLAFALLRADGEELSSVLEFYHVQTGSDNRELFAAALPALLDELLCFSGEGDTDETELRTSRIPVMVEEVAKILTSSDDLPSFLKNHFVGLLNSIDRKMLHSEDLWLQKQALKRIEKLIEMMGPYLSTHVPKIMVLLIYVIDKEALQAEGLSVLHFFIKQLAKLSPSSTKHVISQVVASFIPCLEKCKENPSVHLDKIGHILEDLVVENRLVLKQQIRELPLLPSLPALSEVNKVIQEARGSTSLHDQLKDAVDGLNNESLNVRYMMACELSKLLNLRREEVTALIADDSIVDLDVTSSLISSLLRGCAEESRTAVGQRLKLACGDCLGALGAIDPAKFKGISSERFKIECSDDDLIFELIHKHLARAFRAASDTIVQDSAALAIQELLKLAGCQASLSENLANEAPVSHEKGPVGLQNEINTRGQRLWDRFSNYVKEIIAPCLTSRFQLPVASDSTFAGPVYRPSMSFRRWIFFWIRKLTTQTTGPRSSIFSACRGIVRHDMPTAAYLLPYLVLNVVCHGTLEARHSITEEILSVLNAAALGHSGTTVHGIAGGQSEVCIQAVFTLLDNLGQWVDDLKQETALSQTSNSSAPRKVLGLKVESEAMVNVSGLLASIPKVTLAKASFTCQAHARALMYFESHVREKSGSFNPAAVRIRFNKSEESSSTDSDYLFGDEDISFLMEIYSGLDEPDGLSGLANLRKTSKLQDQLLINEKAGNWAEVLTLCEQALQMEPSSVQRHSDFLNCLLNMCHLQAMVTHVDGLISRIPQHNKTWCMQGAQAAWRLGRWDLMDEYLSSAEKDVASNISESIASFDLGLAKIIQAMMKKDQFMVAERIAQSKQSLLVPLAAAGMDSYVRAYPYIVKLHMLCELEDYSSLLGQGSFLETSFTLDDPKFIKMTKDWENRLRFTQPSLWAREPLLALRRLVFSANNLSAQVGNCWLQYAKLCRSAGHYETAHQAILEAYASGAPNVHIENAKLLWSTRKSDHAIAELQAFIPDPDTPADIQAPKEDRDLAKIILLYTRWIHYTGQKQKEEIMKNYSRVRDLQPKWEKGYFFMAKYCDDLLVDARKRQEDNLASRTAGSSLNPSTEEKPWWLYLPDVLLFYAKGLHKGHKNLFQALPRLLTLWFEFGSIYHREGSSTNKTMRTVFTRISSIMRGCLKDLPTYQWLTVLSQLVSRICHQNEEIVRIVKHIITSVLQEYPQQVLWMMAAVSKSAVAARREAAAEIIQAARRGSRTTSENSGLFIQFASLIDHLIKLCFHPGQPKSKTINISTEFSALKRMMPLGIILPVQQALTVTLPTYDTSLSDSPSYDVFSTSNQATISGIADEAEILSSLQRPKKVVFHGSDGVQRPFLCKPKDDLRKDARMMEFTSMINRLLSKFPESRRRKLYIRTFAVIPLTEDCGMVEWVPHTRGLRHILQDLYISSDKFDRQKTNPKIKNIYDQRKTSEEEMLKSQILPMFPPVFHKWFLTTFSEPASWFRARVAYAHTCAVWSMVGHIVGLGDRHGENILFDSTTGDCVHVDFSCLFDKGLLLDKPELVPFRLTQNMIDGLGITGYKGVFIKVCEITLSVLRTNRETLMSVLETFLHDPLVEWTKSHKSSGVEVQNPHAQRAISNIKARLQGIVVGVGAAPSLPLAVEGQAQRLIEEAISLKNLGKMYIWWMAWF